MVSKTGFPCDVALCVVRYSRGTRRYNFVVVVTSGTAQLSVHDSHNSCVLYTYLHQLKPTIILVSIGIL